MTQISEVNKENLKRYGVLKSEAKVINKELDDIKGGVRDTLEAVNAEDVPVNIPNGKLKLRPRKNWTYSEELEARMLQVKADQKLEEATGQGTFTTSFDVYFTESKK
jgi:hypothetical protein